MGHSIHKIHHNIQQTNSNENISPNIKSNDPSDIFIAQPIISFNKISTNSKIKLFNFTYK